MSEWKPQENDLEKRLAAYYGPQLRERPLGQASWQKLQQQLKQRRLPGRLRWHNLFHRSQRTVPDSIQAAFTRIAYEARMPDTPGMLRYRLRMNTREAGASPSRLGLKIITLTFPLHLALEMGPDELHVLLATALARHQLMRKPINQLIRFLFACMGLVGWVALLLSLLLYRQSIALPIAIGLWVMLNAIAVLMLHVAEYRLALRADTLVVLWLGRSATCQGLHALADRSRRPDRRRWGEPSLVKRIARVCGTRVDMKDRRLTLVG